MATLPEALELAKQKHQAGDLQTAEQIYQRVVEVVPTHADALGMLGVICGQTGRAREALDYFTKAVANQPGSAGLHFNRGVALQELDCFEEAAAVYREALRLKPDYVQAYHNLSFNLMLLGQDEEAIALARQTLQRDPQCVPAHHNLGLSLLRVGQWEEGWPEYEWRFATEDYALPPLGYPRWDGADLPDGTILLRAEQGYGDTLQFVRYAALVKERVGTVRVQCHSPLLRLVAGCPGVDRVMPLECAIAECDVQAPLMSLPGLFKTTPETVLANVPYLFADEALVEGWRGELSQGDEFKIGVVWQGSQAHKHDRRRSFSLGLLAPLARLRNVRLISLQQGPGIQQIQEFAGQVPVTDLGARRFFDFMDTAAVIKNLDLVISADTSVAHLAGALGVPVWVPLPFCPDWRWLLQRDDTPWYPTMRLFRQRQPGGWNEVFERIQAALTEIVPA